MNTVYLSIQIYLKIFSIMPSKLHHEGITHCFKTHHKVLNIFDAIVNIFISIFNFSLVVHIEFLLNYNAFCNFAKLIRVSP